MLNSWINASRTRMKLGRMLGREPDFWADVHDWMDHHAEGRSLLDVGGMYGAWGAFDAEDRGAGPVTMLDVTPPTEACRAEAARRGSRCRYVTRDLHDPGVPAEVGRHDIVLCSGVLYHCPNPMQTLERLRELTGEYLVLGTEVLQEVPGIPQACVFYPGLSDDQRAAFAHPVYGVADGLTTPFDPELGFSNWWWGFSRTALMAMLDVAGWEVQALRTCYSAPGYRALVIATPAGTPSPILAGATANGSRAG